MTVLNLACFLTAAILFAIVGVSSPTQRWLAFGLLAFVAPFLFNAINTIS